MTPASFGDSGSFDDLLDCNNNDQYVWADSAYYSENREEELKEQGYESRIIRRSKSHFPEWSDQDRENRRRSKIRKRVEHVFGFMTNSMRGMYIRTIGLARAKIKIALMNLTYNICRYEQLTRLGVA